MFFDQVPEGLPDPIFGLTDAFQSDSRPGKVNLVMGIYKNRDLHAELLPSVRKAKEAIVNDDVLANYLPMEGFRPLIQELGGLLFGKALWESEQGRIYGAQSVGGTAALRIGAEFLRDYVGQTVYVPQPTWPNHRLVFEKAGCKVETYAYYDSAQRAFNLSKMLVQLRSLPPKSLVLLQGACHNPTGCDPTQKEWFEIADTIRKQQLFPFFDIAYQGFGEGLDEDAWTIRMFLKEGIECCIAYSCSKNFSLYCQRVGAFFVVTENGAMKHRAASQVKRYIRALYSNPPAHGARIVERILQGPLRLQWIKEVEGMRQRIQNTRKELVAKISSKVKSEDFSYLLKHRGMFSFFDLQKSQVKRLIEEFAIYLPDSGRINVAGLNEKNMDGVVDSLAAIMGRS